MWNMSASFSTDTGFSIFECMYSTALDIRWISPPLLQEKSKLAASLIAQEAIINLIHDRFSQHSRISRIIQCFEKPENFIQHGRAFNLYGMKAADAKGGVLYGPRYFQHRGYPPETRANKAAYNAEALKRFWEVSEELTGVNFGPLDQVRVH